MKATEMLTQVKDLLGIEAQAEEVKEETQEQTQLEKTVETKVELAQATLENGTVIEADSFEAGKEVFIITEEEKVALPVGDYTLDDGKILKVEEEGIIASIEDATAEDVEEELNIEYATKEELTEVRTILDEILEKIKEITSVKADKEVKEELSEVEKVSHSPETETAKEVNLFSQNRNINTTLDRVMKTIANFN
tara:strand:- start:7 stop:591 length:585 start_codon:yes stop_codon:yes gene_type:complete